MAGGRFGFIGSFWRRLASDVIGTGVGFASATAYAPLFRDLEHQLNAAHPNELLSPAELAELVIRGVMTEAAAADEAEQAAGIDGERFKRLTLLAGNPPGPQELLELWNRGAIGEADVERGIRQGRFRTEWMDAYKELRRTLLSPSSVAGMVARGLVAHDVGEGLAGRQGLSPADFQRLVEADQTAPAATELLDLLNRGNIGEDEVRAALRRGGLHPRYHDALLELRHYLPSVSDLVRFSVREVFTPATRQRFGMDEDFPPEFAREAARQGLSAEWARAYWAAHWQLPSVTQAFEMFHRGVIDRATLDLLLKSQDVMPFWRGKLVDIAYNVPGRIDLRRMYGAGVIDRPRVLRGYLDLGYNPQDAKVLTDFATQLKLAPEKDLAKGEITSLYQERGLSKERAASMLRSLGYDADEATLILNLAEARRNRTFRNAVVSVVRGRFVARQISDTEAATRLDRIGLEPAERDELLDLWTFQRDETPKLISEAMAVKLLKKKIRTAEWFGAHLRQLGYSEDDTTALLIHYGVIPNPADTAAPPPPAPTG